VLTQNPPVLLEGQGNSVTHSSNSSHLHPSPVYPSSQRHLTNLPSSSNASGLPALDATHFEFVGQRVQLAIEGIGVGPTVVGALVTIRVGKGVGERVSPGKPQTVAP